MHSFRAKLTNILNTIITVVIGIMIFEVYFRCTEIILPSYVIDDPELGRTHKSNTLVNLVGAEGFYMGKINRYGYPGREYPLEKTSNTFRIALIGDSYIEGFQLFERHHFARLLEKDLNEHSKKKIEILNFGTGGADFRGMYLRFIKIAKKFNPDLTLFFIKKEDLLEKDAIPMPQPYLSKDSILFNKLSYDKSESKIRQKFGFVRNFAVGNLFKEVFETIYTGRFTYIFFDKLSLLIKDDKKSSKNLNYNKDNFFEFNKRIIELLSRQNKSKNKSILVEVEELPDYYESIIENNHLESIELFKELNQYTKYELNYWKASGKFGHWNQKAHLIISNYLKKKLSFVAQ